MILEVIGSPALDDFYAIPEKRIREYYLAQPAQRGTPFDQLFHQATPLAIDFLKKTLVGCLMPKMA
jgi:mitogen-activated protein kinase 1/3